MVGDKEVRETERKGDYRGTERGREGEIKTNKFEEEGGSNGAISRVPRIYCAICYIDIPRSVIPPNYINGASILS